MTLEEAVRQTYREIMDGVETDIQKKEDYGKATGWRTAEDKRWRETLNQRIQDYTLMADGLRMAARRAGMKLTKD